MTYFRDMNWTDQRRLTGLGSLLLAGSLCADVTEPPVTDTSTNPPAAGAAPTNPVVANPYQVILDRNPFALKPPPLITTISPPTNPASASSVKLTGFSSDSAGKNWKVWLMIAPQPGKANPQYFSIAEHDKQGDIEVLEINGKENTAKILYAGNSLDLNFKDNALPTPAAPVAPPVPGAHPPGAITTPGIVPAPGTPPPGLKTAATTGMTATPGATAAPTPALRTIPARNVRTAPSVEAQSRAVEAQNDAAVQRLMLEVQRKQREIQGQTLPPLPPVTGSE
jgi:hypothetical protein